jgi:hypothetical protein
MWQEREDTRQKDVASSKRVIDEDDEDDAKVLDLISDESPGDEDEDEISRPRSTKTRKVSETNVDEPIAQPPRKKSPLTTPAPVSNKINFVLPTSGVVPSIRIPISPLASAPAPTKTIVPPVAIAPVQVKAVAPAPRKIPAILENDLPIKPVVTASAPTKTAPVKSVPAPVKAAAPVLAPAPVNAIVQGPAPNLSTVCSISIEPVTTEHRHLHEIMIELKRTRVRDEIISNQLAALSDEVRDLKKQKADAAELMLAMLQKK